MTPTGLDPVAIIDGATTNLSNNLGGVATTGLTVGVGIFALSKGWSLLRRFVG